MTVSSFPLILLVTMVPWEVLSPDVRLGVYCILAATNFLILGYGLPWFWNQVRVRFGNSVETNEAGHADGCDGKKPPS